MSRDSDANHQAPSRGRKRKQPEGSIPRFMILLIVALGTLCGCSTTERAMVAGDGSSGPWWMQATALGKRGELTLDDRSWWERAKALEVGEEFVLAAGEVSSHLTLVRRERFKIRSGEEKDAIVWIIDDDEDGSVREGGDLDSDCYVVDYDRDGTVDRMVDYIDNDGDNDPDEMDIRYFVDGALRQSWCGMDLDDDSSMWSLRGYEYGGPSFFESDPYGDSMIYMNKFNPDLGIWSPVSECPFSFYDTDRDGYSEIVVRISAVPIAYDQETDPDYANDVRRYRGEWKGDMEQMGVVNVRYSFDVDNQSSEGMPLHYEMGFNLVGAEPYDFSGMNHFNALRRPPQVTRVIPHRSLRDICDRYPATETGFTFHEQHDDTISIGYAEHEKNDYRWEGVFWIWERRKMGNTGGPGQKWNVRREWSRRPTNRRELYYSEVDRRIHLFGAEEGWIQVGNFGGLGPLGEIRMFDTDGNGYFDRWEVYNATDPVPVRVTTVRDERARRLPFDYAWLHDFYTRDVLPPAMEANNRLLEAMSGLKPFRAPPQLLAAAGSGSDTERRYAQDLLREIQYHDLRRTVTTRAHEVIGGAKMDDLRWVKPGDLESTPNSFYAWRLLRALQKLDVAYGSGRFDDAIVAIDEIAAVEAALETESGGVSSKEKPRG